MAANKKIPTKKEYLKKKGKKEEKDEPNKVIINPTQQDVFNAFSFGAKFHGLQQVGFKDFVNHIPLHSLKSLIDEVKSGKENFHVKVEKMVRCHPDVANFITIRNYMNSIAEKIDDLLMNATVSAYNDDEDERDGVKFLHRELKIAYGIKEGSNSQPSNAPNEGVNAPKEDVQMK